MLEAKQLTEFQQRAAAMGLLKMLNGKHFSICDLDNLAASVGKKHKCSGPDYLALRNVHCVDWGDTGPELSRMVKEICFDILEIPMPAIEAESNREPEPVRKLRLAFWR